MDDAQPLGPLSDSDHFNEFLDRYLERGFGALSKREVDRLVFSLLVKSQRIPRVEDHFAISRQLRVSLAKAANLTYELRLHDLPRLTPEELGQAFGELLRRTNLGKVRDRVALEVRDRALREEIEQHILNLNLIAPDYTFNRNLLLLDYDTFAALVSSFAGKDAIAKLEAELKRRKLFPDPGMNGRRLFVTFIEGIASGTGEAIGGRIVDFADLVIGGGATTIKRLVDRLVG